MNILNEYGIERISNIIDGQKPDISIRCLTYNHVAYIAQTIEGFLQQETKYSFDIVIYDDASNDGTSEIVRDYARRYPDKIQVLIAKNNLYHHKKRAEIMAELAKKYIRGKYVALCEGDDYWIDNKKLEKQVDFLERHNDYTMTAHNAMVFLDERNHYIYNENEECDIDLKMILESKPKIATASMVMRREMLFVEENELYKSESAGDYKLKCYCASLGRIHYFSDIMSVYRYNISGSWTQKRKTNYEFLLHHLLDQINFLLKFNKYTNCKYIKEIEMTAASYANMAFDDESIKAIYSIFPVWEKLMQDKSLVDILQEIGRYHGVSYMKMITDDFWLKKRVVIWGAGDYAIALTRELLDKNKSVDTYVISDMRGKNLFADNHVYTFENLPLDLSNSEYVLLVAIKDININDAIEKLEEMGVKNYCFPYMFNMNNYHKCSFLYKEK